MKKILAIAVATAISAPAMADMTISGTVAVGYASSTVNSSTDDDLAALNNCIAKVSTDAKVTECVENADYYTNTADAGFGVDTAAITISGSEEVNGMTVAAYMSAGGFARGGDVGGENAGLSISGDFGKVSIDAKKAASNYVVALGGADDFANEFLGESTFDGVAYTLPKMGALTAKLSFSDAINIGTDNGNVDPTLDVSADLGALDLVARYRTYAKNSKGNNTQIRFGGTYDAGVVQVGAGYQSIDADTDQTITSVSAAMPMGATTLGVSYVNAKKDGSASLTGTSFAAAYAISSNVEASVKYNTWDNSATDDKETSVSALVSLSF